MQSARSGDATAQRQPPLVARTGADFIQVVFDGVESIFWLGTVLHNRTLRSRGASTRPRSALRSAAQGILFVPQTRLDFGKRAFTVAGPAAWNNLPGNVRSAPARAKFKHCLNTHLFKQS